MKSLIKAVALAARGRTGRLLRPIEPAAADARAVRAELVQLEKAGYNPNDWMNYPENIQAAQAKIAAAQNTGAQADATGYGSAGRCVAIGPARGRAGRNRPFVGVLRPLSQAAQGRPAVSSKTRARYPCAGFAFAA